MEALDAIISRLSVEKLQHVKAADVKVTGLFLASLVAWVYLGQALIRWHKSNAPFPFMRPRSPDPEKSTDVDTFAEKRLKPTDRPPGSEWLTAVQLLNPHMLTAP